MSKIIVEERISEFPGGREKSKLVSYKNNNFHCSSDSEVNNAIGLIHGKYGMDIEVVRR